MAGVTLFTDLFAATDRATATYVNGISQTIVTEITPVLTVAMVLWFLIYAAGIATGRIESPVIDFMWKSFKITAVIGIALSAGYYQSSVAPIIMSTPDAMAAALVTGQSNQNNAQGNVIDDAASKGFKVAGDAFAKAGVFKEGGISYAFFGLIIGVATGVLTAVGGGLLVSAKVALAILAGLGPLFIVMLLFDATKRFFEAWVGQILSYALLLILVAASFDFLLGLFSTLMSNVAFDSSGAAAANVGEALILAIVTLLILVQLPGIAASLAGGVALNMSGAVSTYGRPFKSRSSGGGSSGGDGGGGAAPAAGGGGGGNTGSAAGYFRGASR